VIGFDDFIKVLNKKNHEIANNMLCAQLHYFHFSLFHLSLLTAHNKKKIWEGLSRKRGREASANQSHSWRRHCCQD